MNAIEAESLDSWVIKFLEYLASYEDKGLMTQ